jgi:ProP effector
MTFNAQRYPRETLEEWVEHLVRKYPACFYHDAALKRPLKKGIQDDLHNESAINVEAALSYYTRDWYYLACVQAGAERIDLDGKKAGVVTDQEARTANKQLLDEKQKLKEKRAIERRNPIATLNSLHANGHISTDQLRKVDAPPLRTETEVKRAADNPLARLESVLGRTAELLTADEDKALQSALVVASLKVLVQEAQRVIASLEIGGESK